MDKMIQIELEHDYSVFDKDNIEEWRAQCQRNVEEIYRRMKRSTGKPFSDECIEHVSSSAQYNRKIAVYETSILGCAAYITLSLDSHSTISLDMYLITPHSHYSGQGISLYSSHRDARFSAIRERYYDPMMREDENWSDRMNKEHDDLLDTVWNEKLSLMINAS